MEEEEEEEKEEEEEGDRDSWWQIEKNGRTLFDRPKPTVGSSANGKRGRRTQFSLFFHNSAHIEGHLFCLVVLCYVMLCYVMLSCVLAEIIFYVSPLILLKLSITHNLKSSPH